MISQIPILIEETATTIYTNENGDDAHNFNLTAIAPLKIMQNWDPNNTLILSYNKYNTYFDNMQLGNKKVFYMFQTIHNIMLPHGFKIEINGVYRSPQASGLNLIDSMWWIDLGLRKSFIEDKLELSLNFADIFDTYRHRFSTNIGDNINEFYQNLRTQYVNIGLRYSFSSGRKFQAIQTGSGPEEVGRT